MVSFQELERNNWLAAGAHLGSAIVIIILYNYWDAAKTRANATAYRYQLAGPNTLPQCSSTGFIPDAPDQCNTEIVFEQPKAITSWNVIYGVLAFFFITAAAHVYYATNGFGTGSYKAAITQGWNPYRWVEYGISASIMSVLIGLVDGTRDFPTLIALALLTLGLQLNGFSVESNLRGSRALGTNAKDSVVGSTVSGWFLFVALWFVLIFSFASLVIDVDQKYTDESVPPWIWFVVIGQLLFYASFGIVQLIHIVRRFKNEDFDYATIESYYILLSFAAKLALAGGIGYGIIFRVRNCPTN